MTTLTAVLWGALGGAVPELLTITKLRKKEASKLPHWLKSPLYWVVAGAWIALGALFAYAYSNYINLNPFLAAHIGASAPLICGMMARNPPDVQGVPRASG